MRLGSLTRMSVFGKRLTCGGDVSGLVAGLYESRGITGLDL
jgi:hypothetical protein